MCACNCAIVISQNFNILRVFWSLFRVFLKDINSTILFEFFILKNNLANSLSVLLHIKFVYEINIRLYLSFIQKM